MNLWAKSLRQLTIASVALFFFSCEDEAKFLGFPNPNNKFDVRYVDIPLGISDIVSADSVITDLRLIVTGNQQTQYVDGIVAGYYQDPDFGKISAQPFLSVYPTSNTALNSTAEFDSVTIQLRLNFHAYGFTGTKELRFGVHEITGDTLSLFGGKRYYNFEGPAYSADPLGEAVVSVNRDYLLDEADSLSNAQDTVMLRGTLDYNYGLRIFNAIKAGFTSGDLVKIFKSNIKGVTLVPGTEEGILGMNVLNAFGQGSRITVHYHTMTNGGAVDDTLSTTLGFEFASFTKIQTDRSGTELAGMMPYTPFETGSGMRYIQSGTGLVTRVDLAPFYEFADTVENILITEARIVIDDVVGQPGAEPHSGLMLRLMDENSNLFLNSGNRLHLERLTPYSSNIALGSSSPYFFAASEDRPDGLAAILYDDENDRMTGFITLFAQSLFANKNDEDGINDKRLRYLALAPANLPYPNASAGPAGDRRVTRTLFHKDNVKLRIFYTRAKTATP